MVCIIVRRLPVATSFLTCNDYFNALEQLCSSASTKTLFEISNYCTRERQLLIINVNSVTVQCKY